MMTIGMVSHPFFSAVALVAAVIGCILAAFGPTGAAEVFRLVVLLRRERKPTLSELRQIMIDLARRAKESGILSLEPTKDEKMDPTLRRLLQLAVDGYDLEAIADIFKTRLGTIENRARSAARLFSFSGQVGLILGIGCSISLLFMHTLGRDPAALLTNLGVLIVPILVGWSILFVSNLCKHWVLSLAERHVERIKVIGQGVLSFSSGDHVLVVAEKLSAFRPFEPPMSAEDMDFILGRKIEAQSPGEYRRIAAKGRQEYYETLKRRLEEARRKGGEQAVKQLTDRFEFEDLFALSDRGVADLLKETNREDLVKAMQETSPELQALFFSGMSERAVRMVISELDMLGDLPPEWIESGRQAMLKLVEDMQKRRALTVRKAIV